MTLPTQELEAELRRREKIAGKLVMRREKLLAELAELDAQIKAAGALISAGRASSGRRGGGRRGRNDMNLGDALVGTLTGKTMSVTEVAEAVQRAGYNTTSPNFRTIVNQTLTKDKRFKRVARGQYTAASGAKLHGNKKRGRKPKAKS